jgi:hypothetical protein
LGLLFDMNLPKDPTGAVGDTPREAANNVFIIFEALH